MKKFKSILRLSLVMLFVCVSASVFAQEIGYKITMPKISKVITVTGNEINFRKTPSTTAPTMVFVCVNETDNCGASWSNIRIPRGQSARPLRASRGETFLVVEETPEWYGVISNGYKAYLSKKFTKEIKTQPITPESLTQKGYYGYENEQYPGIDHGKYRGFAIIDQNGFDSDGFMIGHIVDGFLVLSHHFYLYSTFDENVARIRFNRDESGSISALYGKKVAGDEVSEWNGPMLDYNKLTEQEFEQFIKYSKATTTANEYVVILTNLDGAIRIIADYVNVNEIPDELKTTVSF